VQDVRNDHRAWLYSLPEGQLRLDALCELNVLEQSLNVCQTTVVKDAWARGQEVVVHGWVYGVHNGLAKDLRMSVATAEDLARVYAEALEDLHQRYAALV